MEGVMMKNGDRYAVAVRKPDKEIVVKCENYNSIIKNKKINSLPLIRGVFNFVDSLVLGMKTLMYSAEFFMEDEEEENPKKEEKKNSGSAPGLYALDPLAPALSPGAACAWGCGR